MLTQGCTFRKKALNKNEAAPVAEKQLTIKEKIDSLSSKDAIVELDKMDDAELVKQAVLDTAIQHGDRDIVVYLLEVRRLSPFAYSATSLEQIEKDPRLKATVYSYQTPMIEHFIVSVKEDSTLKNIDEMLAGMKITNGSCLNILEQVVSAYFYVREPDFFKPETIETRLPQKATIEAINNILATPVCKEVAKQIPPALLANWYETELKRQYYKKFESSQFIELLETFGSIQSLMITVSSPQGEVNIDPRLLVLAGLPNYGELAKKQFWLNLLEPHINLSPNFYSLNCVSCSKPSPESSGDMGNYQEVGETLILMAHPSQGTVDPSYKPDTDNYGVPTAAAGMEKK